MDALRALDLAGVSIRFTVTSAYGFVKRFQNPNIDPHQPGEQRRLASLAEAVSGYDASDTGSLTYLGIDEQRLRLKKLTRQNETTVASDLSLESIIGRFAPAK